ncbi:hypothetical protein CAMSH0001_2250 [Campylobacter showae RM3277]|uniref:Uncharacterized protein n=1 Tax=Campylobacter showae RM3277 TaxID=553219 RepID=C6RFY7_9BACT|nr:hypothetical protein CAMSH0001_2250 [Campylobacter showae RM3277]
MRCLKRNLADKFRRFALLFGLFLKFKERGKFYPPYLKFS